MVKMMAQHVWYIPTPGLDESAYLFAEHPELGTRCRQELVKYEREECEDPLSMRECKSASAPTRAQRRRAREVGGSAGGGGRPVTAGE